MADATDVEIPTQKRDFQSRLDELVRTFESSKENPGSYKGARNERCVSCMFTTNSRDCFQCTYCTDCERSTHATHCRECVEVHNSSYCVRSERVTGSKYVVLSKDCHDCTFCFGCVGLVGKEFHILNRKFSRNDYFAILPKLERAFGVSRR